MQTTVGQLLLNESLPEDMRDYSRVIDKNSLKTLFQELADRYPDKYAELNQKMHTLAREAVTTYGGVTSLSLESLRTPERVAVMRRNLERSINAVVQSDGDETTKNNKIIKLIADRLDETTNAAFDEAKKANNPLAMQVTSGARGNAGQLRALNAGDMLVVDHKDRPIPIPILNSYSEGLDPVQYWAGAYGARKGYVSVKFATPRSGFLAKQLALATHRLIVTEKDCGTANGIPVLASDPDNEGTVLAQKTGGLDVGSVLHPKDLRKLGDKNILVRSPITCQAEHGVCQRCAGVRERGGFPPLGDNIGIAAAQAIAEPIGQGQLCLAETTLVRMADWSVKPIEFVEPDDWVMGADRGGNLFPVKVLRRHDNGVRACVHTRFRLSKTKECVELVSTLDHKLLGVARRWHPKTELAEAGVWPVGEHCVRLCATLPRSVNNSGGRPEPFALLLGLLLGDGCYTSAVQAIHLSCYDPSLVTCISEYLSALGLKLTKLKGHTGYYRVSQLKDTIRQDPDTGQTLPGDRNPIKLFLSRLGLHHKYAHEKALPEQVWEWDQRSVQDLIAGLFATDGSVYCGQKSRPYLSYCSTSLPLIEGLRKLLSVRFAIYPSPLDPQSGGRKRTLYSFSITRSQDVRRFSELFDMPGKKGPLLRELLSQVEESEKDTRYFYRKAQIEIGELATYDIEVDHPDHLFVLANGLIVSNSAKHTGGQADASSQKSGMDLIEQLTSVPKTFQGGAAIATVDGRVDGVENAPQGGQYVTIAGTRTWVGPDQELTVKKGDRLEAGDTLSTGLPNPAEIVRYKGVGEGRRYYMEQFRKAMNDSQFSANRRNVELLSRGLINHVRISDLDGPEDTVPDDVMEFDSITRGYRPRFGFKTVAPKQAVGLYLESPALHYSIGTKVTPRVAKQLGEYGVASVKAHADVPSFEPEMTRAMETLSHSSDWMVRLGGFHLKSGLTKAVHRTQSSNEHGTSYIPALAKGVDFGKVPEGKGY